MIASVEGVVGAITADSVVAAAESELLIYLDCDFTYPADAIPVVRRLIEDEGMDVVNCARTRSRPAAMDAGSLVARMSKMQCWRSSGWPVAPTHALLAF